MPSYNVAWSISICSRHDVVLADMDLPFGTANISFDQDPTLGIADAVFSPERIDGSISTGCSSNMRDHLSILAAFEPGADIRLRRTCLCRTDRRRSSAVLRFGRAGRSSWLECGWTWTTLMRVDEVVIVATPDLANLRNTKTLLDTLARLR